MYCPSCGADAGDSGAFCQRCGSSLVRRCPACHEQTPPGSLFCSACGAKLTSSADGSAVQPDAPPEPSAAPVVERRQLTVMFCDLVGSTDLSSRLDLEDLHEAITAYQLLVKQVVERFGGYVARHLGDGILVLFGYPLAQEDDAERAVRAGLAVVEALAALRVPREAVLQVRIGIATGTVAIGAFAVGRVAHSVDVIGEAPNVAARLQSIAAPNAVLIADGTRRLVGQLFEFRDLGRIRLKGFAADSPIWQVLQPRAVRSRFEALRATQDAPLVGRGAEMEALLDQWRLARQGTGRAVLLTGEAGIGKSRIAASLRLTLGGQTTDSTTFSCAPSERSTTLGPFVQVLRAEAGLMAGDPPDQQLARFRDWAGTHLAEPPEAFALVADLLAIPGAEPAVPVSISPQRRRRVMLEGLLGLLIACAENGPALLIMEDLHWADPTSIELMTMLVDRIATLPILVVATSRPEFTPDWTSRAHGSVLPVNRLGHQDNLQLIDSVVGGKAIPPQVTELILARADGVPLFVEELTKATLESGLLREEARGYVLEGSFSRRAIPATLSDSLMARLDRLGNARSVAQIGAAIGRSFSFRQLAAVLSDWPEAELHHALQRLEQAALLIRERELPDAIYTFRHALVQDAAYASLLRLDRVRLHGRIAEAFEHLFPELQEAQPELLAQHFDKAGAAERAIACWLRAGEKARRRSAFPEAVEHLTSGLNAVAALPWSAARDRYELDLRMTLGSTYMALRGWAGAEIATVLTPALPLCRSIGRPRQMALILRVLWQHHATRGHGSESAAMVAELQATAGSSGDPLIAMNAAYAACATSFWRGDFPVAETHARDLARFNRFREQEAAQASESDPNTMTLNCWESYRLWIQGYPDQAVESAQEQETFARRLGVPFNLGFILTVGSAVHGFRRDPDALLAKVGAATAIAREQNIPFIEAVLAPVFSGPGLIALERHEEALAQNKAGLAHWQGSGGRLIGPYLIGIGAEALARLGRFDEGLTVVSAALTEAEAIDEHWAEADLLRIKGDLMAGMGARDAAIRSYRQSLQLARKQGARSWELRAALGLTALLAADDRHAALALIEPLLAWFREGLDTPDLQRAAGLVRALS
jgi:class 3 adenylate cyclase/tetratricopeptide (TPR) repeat protein